MDVGDEELRQKFADALTEPDVLKSIIKNTYGSYVVQKLLQVSKDNKDVC